MTDTELLTDPEEATDAHDILDSDSDFTADGQQFLTFSVQSEEYGIDILSVQEIKGFSKVRPIPNAPHYIRGVMNLRGTVVPVLDLRARFGLEEVEYDRFTVIIVVSVEDKVVGLIVDAVSDVLNIADNQIDETPELSGSVDTTYFEGLGKVGEKLVLLLNLERLVGLEQLQAFDAPAA